jgi:hypothetical protein
MLRFFALPVIVAVMFISASPVRAWGCLAVTPWVNGDRSYGTSFDLTERDSQKVTARSALRACERQRAKDGPDYPRCYIAGCAPHVRSKAEALAISLP